jgi:hypothetical protein
MRAMSFDSSSRLRADLANNLFVLTLSGFRKHPRDLPIGLFVTDRAMEAWYHASIA